jgi:capsular exopolysaccharide synthesis family protein
MTRLADALKRAGRDEHVSVLDVVAPDHQERAATPTPLADLPQVTTAPLEVATPFMAHDFPALMRDSELPHTDDDLAAWPAADEAPRSAEPSKAPKWFAGPAINQVGGSGVVYSDQLIEKVVIHPKARPAAVEQYRRLAAALHHSQRQFATKVILLASALNGEGKSLSACNLALTLSHSYRRRVLLIDADLRRPSIQDMLKLVVTPGLSEGLRASQERPLQRFQVSPRLFVLPAGRSDPDPIGGLASPRMAEIVTEAASLFDFVLIDSPPVGLVPDAKVLSNLSDAVVLVIRAGASPCALVRQAVEALGQEKIFGVVLNAAETTSTLHESSYYGRRT